HFDMNFTLQSKRIEAYYMSRHTVNSHSRKWPHITSPSLEFPSTSKRQGLPQSKGVLLGPGWSFVYSGLSARGSSPPSKPYMVLRTTRLRTHGKGLHIEGTPRNALPVVSRALGELSRAPLRFLSIRHAVLYSDGYPLAVIGPLRYNFQTTSFPESHISGPRVSCFIPYISQYRHV